MSGFLAGSTGKTVTAPLSRMEIIAQTASLTENGLKAEALKGWPLVRRIYNCEGLMGLWTGNTLACISRGIGSAFNFAVVEATPDRVKELKIGFFPVGALIPGSMGCLISAVVQQPFEVVRSSQMGQIGDCPSILSVMEKMRAKLLSRGFGLMLGVNVPRCGICYGVYPEAKARLPDIRIGGVDLRPVLAGGISGIVANLSTYPLNTLRCRQQAKDFRGRAELGVMEDFKNILHEHGVRGLFRGAGFDVMKVGLNMAVTFKAYECLRSWNW